MGRDRWWCRVQTRVEKISNFLHTSFATVIQHTVGRSVLVKGCSYSQD